MFIGLGMPIPDLSNKPGPGRPGWGPIGSYDFQFEVTGDVTFKAIANSAGTFSISYPDGTTTTTSGSSSITSQGGAGIISINKEDGDTTFCDEFAIVGNKDRVIKVVSWGQRTWNKLQDAFKDCTNLTEISTTSLTTDTIGNLNNLFSGCTSLTDVSIKGWNLLSGCSIEGLFDGCTNIEKLEATGLALKIRATSRSIFKLVGSTVTNGCEFLMSGLDFSTSTNMTFGDTSGNGMFQQTKIKPSSNFSNWNLTSSATIQLNSTFLNAKILGDNSTLNISNWTLLGNTASRLNGFFSNFETSDGANRGLNIDITNWNLGNIYSVTEFFKNCDLSTVTGLSTLTASNIQYLGGLFQFAKYLSIPSNDNLSSSFRNAVNAVGGGFNNFAQNLGSSLTNESDWGEFPNIDGFNLSSATVFSNIFAGGRYSTGINLGNVTFPTTAVSFSAIFSGTKLSAGNGIDLTTTTLKSSNFQNFLQNTVADFMKMGTGVDWSSVTTMYGFNQSWNGTRPGGAVANSIELPTGLNISSLNAIGNWGIDANYSQCQIDNFIRSMWLYQRPPLPSTPTLNFTSPTGLTAAPSLVRSKVDDLITAGWNFSGEASPDIALPFAYASYAVDPTGITTISPTTTPPAGSVFTATNSLSINSSTGVITINSFRGGSTIRCTYPDGCYNEVQMLIQVPLKLNVTIPNGGFDFAVPFKVNNSAIVQWETGGATQDVTGTTTNTYVNNTGSDKVETISIFDGIDSSTNYFKGFNAWITTGTQFSMQIDIAQWGEPKYYDNGLKFQNCNNISITATDTPDLSQETSLAQAFRTKYGGGAASGYNTRFSGGSAMGNWNVSTITNIQTMFRGVTSANFNQDLNSWNTSNITDMSSYTFGQYPAQINNQSSPGINNWDTSNVTDMNTMFFGHNSWTGLDLSNWDTSKVTSMSSMFYQCDIGATNFNTKMYNGTLRWDVSKVTNFSGMFNYGTATQLTSTTFPQNWRFASGATDNISMSQMMYNGSAVFSLTGGENFIATKTISETFYGGTSYTAWNMERVSSINQAFSRIGQVPNLNIGTWQITSALTNANGAFQNYNQYAGKQLIDQDLGHWDVTGITSAGSFNQWMNNTAGNKLVEFSTANYDSLLDITDGWGQDAGSVQSGVSLNMGTSQYTPGNLYYGTQGANTYQNNKIYNGGADLRLFTSIGDVVERPVDPNGTFDAYAIITGYDANGQRATTQGNIGPTDYTVMDSSAVKGRIALINAGWTITDGGAYIPFDSVEMTINVSAGDTFSITPQSSPNNFKVDWGDGNGFVGDPNNGGANYTGSGFTATSPAYASGGNKTVKICEDSSQYIHSLSQNYNGPSASDKQKIININHWGTNSWKTFYRTFFGCNNLVLNTTTTPNLANGPSMAGMFQTSGADFTNSNIGNWDMSAITDVTSMFQQTSMNVDISGWNTGNITTMLGLFYNNSTFNQDISNWDTSNVTSLYVTFSGASSLNADLNTKDTGSRLAWDVSNVTSFQGALSGTTSMTYDIDKWQITTDASKTVTMANMFTGNINWMSMEPKTVTVGSGAYQKTYLAWDTQRVTSLSETFHANNAFNKDIGKWDTSSVTNMYRTFRYATAFNNGGQPMNTRSVTAGTGATARTYNAWDVSNVTIFERGPFENNQAFNQDVSNWDVSNAANALVRGFENAQVFDHYLPWNLNTSANPPSTYYLYNMFNNSGMSKNNYTDTIVYWANFVKNQTPDAPLNVDMANQSQMEFESARSGGANFANAAEARTFLTDTVASGGAGWTINGDTVIPLPFSPLKFKVNIQTTTTTSNLDFNIPYVTGTNFTINWGDSNTDTNLSATNSTITHQYDTAGTYTIEVGASNSYPTRLAFNGFGGNPNTIANNGALAVTEITQWGSIPWSYVESMWDGCTNLDIMSATDTPDFSNLTSHSGSFPSGGLTRFLGGSTGTAWQAMRGPSLGTVNASINTWDVSSVRDFSACFAGGGSTSAFNANISNWDLSGVTKTGGLVSMFHGCLKFNQPLSNWTLPSPVTSLNGFLMGCEDFNQDISNFNMTNITDIGKMFYGCDDFNATNLQNWERTTAGNTSTMANITNMADLFNYKKDVNKTFNNAISSWNTSGVTSMANLSANVTGNGQGMTSAFVTGWDTSSVSNFSAAFKNAYDFNSNLGSLNITSLTNASQMFYTWASGQSTANYTDTIIGWATFVKAQTPDAPLNVNLSSQNGRTFDTTRTASGFTPATAGRARSFLTLDVTVSGGTGVNGVYYYDYANDKWVKETDSTYVIEWNSDESSWELKYEGSTVNNGSGGTQTGGPESSTSWSGGLTVVDSSKGWTITSDTITS